MSPITALSKAQVSEYRSLKQSKFRQATGLFLLEGVRLCQDVIASGLELEACITLENFDDIEIPDQTPRLTANQVQLEQLSDSRSPQPIICIGFIPIEQPLPQPDQSELVLVLDRIADPGNLGTILRTARWFGVKDVVLSIDCADPFNPKAVRASMGAIAAVNLHRHIDLESYLGEWKQNEGSVLALDTRGEPLRGRKISGPTLLIAGSEAHGVDPALLELAEGVSIPGSGDGESLNAAMATGIALWELTTTHDIA